MPAWLDAVIAKAADVNPAQLSATQSHSPAQLADGATAAAPTFLARHSLCERDLLEF
jgi:hypothetical protein